MTYTLALESVRDDITNATQLCKMIIQAAGMSNSYRVRIPKPWVARITGTCTTYGLERDFQRGKREYYKATKRGCRGVFFIWHLEDGVYEVNEVGSRMEEHRYFIRVRKGQSTEITREDVIDAADRTLGKR